MPDNHPAQHACRTLRFGALLALCLGVTPVARSGAEETPAPLRVLLESPPSHGYRVRHANPAAPHGRGIVLKYYFEHKLPLCTGIRLVSPARANTVFGELTAMGTGLRLEDKVAAANRMLPIDAIVRFPDREINRATARVKLLGRALELPDKGPDESIVSLVERTAHFLADALSLPDSDRAWLADVGFPNDDVIFGYFAMSRGMSRNPANSGLMRLTFLRPKAVQYRGEPQYNAQILRGASLHVRSLGDASDFTPTALQMALAALPSVLGTPYENDAIDIIRLRPGIFSRMLIEWARPATRREDDIDDLLDEMFEGTAIGSATPQLLTGIAHPVDADTSDVPMTEERRLGALRLSGLLSANDSLDILLAGAGHPRAEVRRAAATALGRMIGPRATEALRPLRNDPDAETAFRAAHALAARDAAPPPDLIERAAALVASTDPELRRMAVETVAQNPAALPHVLLMAWRDSGRADLEKIATPFLMREAPDPSRVPALLDDPRIEMVNAALEVAEAAPQPLPPEWITALVRMANEPYQPLADRARRLVEANRPADPLAAAAFEIEYEHPYRRRRLLESFAAAPDPAMRELLFKAIRNQDPHLRAQALDLLDKHGDAQTRDAVLQLLQDPHTWVRVVAAGHAVQWATTADRAKLEQAASREDDPVVKLYLSDALAAIGAAEPPTALPAARSAAAQPNLTWLREMGADVASSPFQAYYCAGPPPQDLWRQAHEAGKIVFVRFSSVWAPNPGRIMTEPRMRDGIIQTLRSYVKTENLQWTDGMVFDEQWSFPDAQELWNGAWRLFCQESGIAPDTVDGDHDRLTVTQRYAWSRWAADRVTEGFNLRSDYVRRYYGRLRPGLQIGTFLTGGFNNHLGPWSKDLDFDVSLTYTAAGDNRMAYTLVRRAKTLWPDRPTAWMGNGIGGREANPVRRTNSVPEEPFFDRANRAYADIAAAWIGGGDAGWSSAWLLLSPEFDDPKTQLTGITLNVEDITPDSQGMQTALTHLFLGVAEAELAVATPETPDSTPDAMMDLNNALRIADDLIGAFDQDEQQRRVETDLEDHKEILRRGLLCYRRFVYDCARLFASLPRRHPQPTALVVRRHVSVDTQPSTPYPLIPAEALLNEFDFANDVNLLAELDLSRYRLIILHDAGIIESGSLQAISEWLRATNGLLYLHRAPPRPLTDNDAAAGQWPWNVAPALQRLDGEHRGRPVETSLHRDKRVHILQAAITAGIVDPGKTAAQALLSNDRDGVTLALWRDTAARGVVLADGVESADSAYLKLLRDILNQLHAESGIGMPIDGPLLQVRAAGPDFLAAAASGHHPEMTDTTPLTGVDLFSGEPAPRVGKGRSAAVVATVAERHVGYSASGVGLTALADQPFLRAATVGNALELENAGLLRIAGGSGGVRVMRLDNQPLPVVGNDPWAWVELGTTDGIFIQTFGDRRNPVAYVRANTPVRATAMPRE